MLAFIMKIWYITGSKFKTARSCFINENSTAEPTCKNGIKYYCKFILPLTVIIDKNWKKKSNCFILASVYRELIWEGSG